MSQTNPPLDPLVRQALEWQVTFWSGEVSDAEQAAFQSWLGSHPAHQAAWQKVQRLEARLGSLPGDVGSKVLRKVPAVRQARRRVLGALTWLAGGGLTAYAVRQTPQWLQASADCATRTGERRQITLEEGTRIDLNSASAIDIHYDGATRRITLRRGEILISTAADTAVKKRPFIVASARGEVQALGTRFRVQQEDEFVRVAVYEGAVAIRPENGTAERLSAGRQARFDSQHVISEGPANADASAWTHGQLIAERMRLAEFIGQLARHRTGFLRCDPIVAELPVSGVFPIDNTDRVLAALGEALPVRISYLTPFWVTISPR